MGQKRHKPEEIVAKLRQVDVLVGVVCRRVRNPTLREDRSFEQGVAKARREPFQDI